MGWMDSATGRQEARQISSDIHPRRVFECCRSYQKKGDRGFVFAMLKGQRNGESSAGRWFVANV